MMHKDFYASGFIYHQRSQQILLQQENSVNTKPVWTLFGGKSLAKETEQEAFLRIINKLLKLNLKLNKVYSVYNYFHKELEKDNFVHYAEISKLEKFLPSKKLLLSWFSFKQILKLDLTEQTKQDIIVAQRVINSAVRRRLGQQTIG